MSEPHDDADDAHDDGRDDDALAPEDAMRADLYALLARLFYAPPDAALLAMIANAPEIGSEADDLAFAKAWAALSTTAATAAPEAIATEHATLFVGTGRAPVTPYFTHYVAASAREQRLADLKQTLQRLRLARSAQSSEPEDHVAGLFDAMRHLVQAGSGTLALARQRDFFEQWIAPGYASFCAAVRAADEARFYRHVAALTERFLAVEAESLSML